MTPSPLSNIWNIFGKSHFYNPYTAVSYWNKTLYCTRWASQDLPSDFISSFTQAYERWDLTHTHKKQCDINPCFCMQSACYELLGSISSSCRPCHKGMAWRHPDCEVKGEVEKCMVFSGATGGRCLSWYCLASGKGLQMLLVSAHPGTSAVKQTARCDLWSWCDGL